MRAGLSNANLIKSPLLLLRPQVFLVGGHFLADAHTSPVPLPVL